MTTALDIITGAAKLLGVVYKSEALTADEAADGLVSLNDMLGTWSNDNLVTFAFAEESFPLSAGVSSYTIGTGQTFNTTRPVVINYAYVRLGSIDYELQIISPTEYDSISTKSVGGGIPRYMSYSNDYPSATINVYPVPSGGYTIFLESNKPLTGYATLTTTFAMPPGWNRAAKYNLALDMAPEFGVDPSAVIVDTARKSLGAIKRSTSANTSMPFRGDEVVKPYVLSGGFA